MTIRKQGTASDQQVRTEPDEQPRDMPTIQREAAAATEQGLSAEERDQIVRGEG